MPILQDAPPPPYLFTIPVPSWMNLQGAMNHLPLVPAGVRLESSPAAGHILDYYPAGNNMMVL